MQENWYALQSLKNIGTTTDITIIEAKLNLIGHERILIHTGTIAEHFCERSLLPHKNGTDRLVGTVILELIYLNGVLFNYRAPQKTFFGGEWPRIFLS